MGWCEGVWADLHPDVAKQDVGTCLLQPHCHFVAAENARFYAENQQPFVMGTTGGDREKLIEDVKAAGVYAVVAPNMGKQVGAAEAPGAHVSQGSHGKKGDWWAFHSPAELLARSPLGCSPIAIPRGLTICSNLSCDCEL